MASATTKAARRICTQRGRLVDLLRPTAEDIDPAELACLLSRINRFGGHTRADLPPYTVAQHCCLVADLVPDEYKLAALLHDGHEAYLGCDLTRPLKALLDSDRLRAAERAWDQAIAERFGVPLVYLWSPVIKEADDAMLAAERRVLMGKDVCWREVLRMHVQPWPASFAKEEFLERLTSLAGG